MVLFVKITIAKVVFYWTMVLIAQFLPVNLLFFVSSMLSPSRYRYFQLVAGGSSSLQFVPARSSSVFILVCTVKKAYSSVFVICCIPVQGSITFSRCGELWGCFSLVLFMLLIQKQKVMKLILIFECSYSKLRINLYQINIFKHPCIG